MSTYAKDIKMLMIGNSFSRDAVCYLPDVVASVDDCNLKFKVAMIPSAHWDNLLHGIAKDEKSPDAKAFRLVYRLPEHKQRDWYRPRGNDKLVNIIKSDDWDIISIHGFRPEPFHPDADKVIDYIKKYAPKKAEFVIQETWSFSLTDDRVAGPKPKWGVTQQQMSEILQKNYLELSSKHNFRLIPIGYAVDLYRKNCPIEFPPVPIENIKDFTYPELPDLRGEAVGQSLWLRKKDGSRKIHFDTLHLNKQGHYLQACIWFAMLFDRKVEEIKFYPEGMDKELAEFIRRIAQQAIDTKR